MSVEVQHRLNIAHEIGYRNCGAAAVAAILPKPLDQDLDLLQIANEGDGTLELLNDVISVGLYRQGYMPMTQMVGNEENAMRLMLDSDSRRVRNLLPYLEYFGTLVNCSSLESSESVIEAIEEYIAEGGYDIRQLISAGAVPSEDIEVISHVIAIPSTHRTSKRKKFGYVDTGLDRKDGDEPVRLRTRRLPRITKHLMPDVPAAVFDTIKGVIFHGMKLDHYRKSGGSQTEKTRAIAYYEYLSDCMREKAEYFAIA